MTKTKPAEQQNHDIEHVDDHSFQESLEAAIQYAEQLRMRNMNAFRQRQYISTTITLTWTVIGTSLFAWFFLVETNLLYAFIALGSIIFPPVFFMSWAAQPLRNYKKAHKTDFMPKVAKAMGGLSYHSKKGINRKLLQKSGLLPPHDVYDVEDCFSGTYKDARFMMSEARLKNKNSDHYTFDGLFVLVELKNKIFQGYSLLTADSKLANRAQKKLQQFPFQDDRFSTDFSLLSNNDDAKNTITNENFLNVILNMYILFDKPDMSAAFFSQKYIFLSIPYSVDMFEASDLHIPIRSNAKTMKCKKEIDQILSIIDVMNAYNAS